MNKHLEEEIRKICTYYSELGEGTAGYSLSEEQFQKLFDLFRSHHAHLKERVEKMQNAYDAQGNDKAWNALQRVQDLLE